MKKRRKKHFTEESRLKSSAHFENLIELRESNPQGYARLGEGPNRAVEKYEVEQLASTFELRVGTERLLELRERAPKVYAQFSKETRRRVEEYAERKRANDIVTGTTER